MGQGKATGLSKIILEENQRCRKPMKQDNGTGDKEQVDQLDDAGRFGLLLGKLSS